MEKTLESKKRGERSIFQLVNRELVLDIVRHSLREDVGYADITTASVVGNDRMARGRIIAKQPGILCGVEIAEMVFKVLDSDVTFEALRRDGSYLEKGTIMAEVGGSAATLLTGERTCLNFLQHLSGIATRTRDVVDSLGDCKTLILDTRKTAPLLRALQKYAVRVGGAKNHRMGLFDAVLIKNNHLKFASIGEAVERCRQAAGPGMRIEIEVENFDQLNEALKYHPDIIMLDNMSAPAVRKAIEMIDRRCMVEVSGNINDETIGAYCNLGADFISMGGLTHSVKALDISLSIEPA